MTEHRLLVSLPHDLRAAALEHRATSPDWLTDGLVITAHRTNLEGAAVWATRSTWAARGYPARTIGADPSSTGPNLDPHPTGISDRTGDTASTRTDQSLEVYRRGLADLDAALAYWRTAPDRPSLARLISAGFVLHRLIDAATPSTPDAATRRRLALEAEPGCEHCAKVGQWADAPRPPLIVGTTPIRLCRWCRGILTELGTLPSEKLSRAHHDGNQTEVRRIKSAQHRARGRV